MNAKDKELFRLAALIRDRVISSQPEPVNQLRKELNLTISHLDRLEVLQRRLDLCARRGLLLAGQRVREQVPFLIADLEHSIQIVRRVAQTQPPPIPTPRDLVLELQQLKQEFGEYAFDSDEQTLSAQTDPINLEGISLGPFRIVLHLDSLGARRQQSALRIVALDPNPPTSNESVTHPHVSDENLCAGDATAAIEAAMVSGRIADLFILVRSVLTTYNPHSPYVSLESWHGTPCAECGNSVSDEDDLYTCQACDQSICGDCIIHCNCCDAWICPGCSRGCPLCDESCCKTCLETCETCGRELCHNCKVDGLCPGCLENKETQHEQQEAEETPELAPSDAADR